MPLCCHRTRLSSGTAPPPRPMERIPPPFRPRLPTGSSAWLLREPPAPRDSLEGSSIGHRRCATATKLAGARSIQGGGMPNQAAASTERSVAARAVPAATSHSRVTMRVNLIRPFAV